MKKIREMTKRIGAVLLTVVMLVSLLMGVPVGDMREVNATTTLQNPRRDSNNVVTWDCVYFGNYPQSDATGKKKDPIKWRVLFVDGNDAFLIADQILDVQPFNKTYVEVTWETCTIRSWLNGYGSASNICGIDYSGNNFIDVAFNQNEKNAIKTTLVDNTETVRGANGGNNTRDKLYYISWTEATTAMYGFSEGPTGDGYFPDRVRTYTNYAYKARNYTGEVFPGFETTWNTRVMDFENLNIMTVYSGGEITGGSMESAQGVCPVLHLDISISNVWSHAGTVSSDGTIQEPSIETLPAAGTKKTLSSGQYKITKSSTKTKEVTFVKPKSSKKTSVTIPATVKIDGYIYKVTAIADKAFKNNKKIKSVIIGKNVKKIGKESFRGCKKLKKITIKSAVLKSVGKNAIQNIDRKATIKVPKKQLKKYKKLLKSKTGYKKTMKIKK